MCGTSSGTLAARGRVALRFGGYACWHPSGRPFPIGDFLCHFNRLPATWTINQLAHHGRRGIHWLLAEGTLKRNIAHAGRSAQIPRAISAIFATISSSVGARYSFEAISPFASPVDEQITNRPCAISMISRPPQHLHHFFDVFFHSASSALMVRRRRVAVKTSNVVRKRISKIFGEAYIRVPSGRRFSPLPSPGGVLPTPTTPAPPAPADTDSTVATSLASTQRTPAQQGTGPRNKQTFATGAPRPFMLYDQHPAHADTQARSPTRPRAS